eukprot:350905-Chlamydomonas_euryale.AAC.14
MRQGSTPSNSLSTERFHSAIASATPAFCDRRNAAIDSSHLRSLASPTPARRRHSTPAGRSGVLGGSLITSSSAAPSSTCMQAKERRVGGVALGGR